MIAIPFFQPVLPNRSLAASTSPTQHDVNHVIISKDDADARLAVIASVRICSWRTSSHFFIILPCLSSTHLSTDQARVAIAAIASRHTQNAARADQTVSRASSAPIFPHKTVRDQRPGARRYGRVRAGEQGLGLPIQVLRKTATCSLAGGPG